MLKQYKGRLLSSIEPTTNTSFASGMWALEEHMQGVRAGAWPSLVPPALYAFTNATFTPGSQIGRTGPDLTTARAGLTGTGVDTWKSDTSYFNTSSGIQLWTVPETGTYRIEAYGAEGGRGESSLAQGKPIRTGKGARIRGDFTLTQGDIIKIVVGQQGRNGGAAGGNYSGGGGGGSYVVTNSNVALIVAGGGNGENWGSWNTFGPSGLVDNSNVTGGTGGGSGERAAGGGGFTGDGGAATTGNATGGLSFTNGATGGAEDTSVRGGDGGFGGGGGGRWEGGGGGGYSGGRVVTTNSYDTSFPTFGAGSYNNGVNQSNSSGDRSGNGQVIITKL